jgi:hypothetical protein
MRISLGDRSAHSRKRLSRARRFLTATGLPLLLVVPLTVPLAIPAVPAAANEPAPEFSFNNGFLRFGKVEALFDWDGPYDDNGNPPRLVGIDSLTTVRESVNSGGLLDTPYYFSTAADSWFQLTFSERALDMAVGAGRCVGDLIAPPTSSINFQGLEAGKCFWHRNTAMASSNGDSVFPHFNAGTSNSSGAGTRGGLDGFTRSTTVTNGAGSITTQGSFTLVPPSTDAFASYPEQYSFQIRHVYELGANATFIRATTTITNTTEVDGAPAAAPNVNIWVGTRDDYIGTTDQPAKIRGNITADGFARLTAPDQPSNALQVYSGAEGILFYSTTPGVDTVFADCCGFYNQVLPIPPAFSGNTESSCRPDGVLEAIACNDATFDGSYAIILPAGDMAPGASRTIVWYYAAGPLDALASVVEQIATDSSGATPQPPNAAPVDPLEPVVELAIEQSSGLSGVDSLLVRDGAVVPVTTTLTRSAGPSGGLVIEDGSDTLRVTVTTAGGASPTTGVIVAPDGEIVCEICAQLAAGLVVEAWIYSTPRLAAAVRVDVEDGICPLLRIPVGAPLDGAGPIAPGRHTLQLRMITDAGYEILSIPITIGTSTGRAAGAPVPTRVNTGGGPVPIMPLPLALGLLIATAGLLLIQRERQLAWAYAWATRPRRTRTIPGRRLTAFDALAQQLDTFRQEQRH